MTYSYPNTLQNRHSYATLAQLKNVSWLNITDTLSDVGLSFRDQLREQRLQLRQILRHEIRAPRLWIIRRKFLDRHRLVSQSAQICAIMRVASEYAQ